jgi:hypothetical protein
MAKGSNTIRDIILRSGLVDEMQMKSAIAKQQQWGGSICKTLTDMGWVAEDTLIELLGQELRMPVMHLGNWARDAQAMARLDVDFCETYGVFPVSLKNRALTLAMYDPTDIGTVDEAQRRADARVIPVLVSETEIRNAILKHYRKQQPRTQSNKALKAIKRMRQETRETEVPLEIQAIGGMSEPVSMPNEQDFDELMSLTDADGLSTEDLGRIEAARLHQQKTASIVKALTELLQEKGLLKNRRR